MPSKQTSTRRDFLQGRSAADAVADLAERTFPLEEHAGRGDADRYLMRVARRAMACQFEVLLNAGEHDDATAAAVAALDLVEALEDQLTVYRETSEITHVNRTAHQGPVTVEPRLFQLLVDAVRLWRETGGAFDVTSGPLSKVWGFFQREGAMPSAGDLAAARQLVGSEQLTLDAREYTVQFEREGMEINLGGIGKGYALERAAELLGEQGLKSFVIHGGQSSVLARGSRAAAETDAAGWPIAVAHPLRPDKSLAEIRLFDQALGTAGTSRQFFRHEGRRYGHIIDPRTGEPANKLVSATVVAPTAAEADALATAFFSLGLEDSMAYCAGQPEIAALLQCPVGDRNEVEIRHAGFAEGQLILTGS